MLRNPLSNEPVAIAGAIRAALHALVLLGVLAFDAEQLAGVSLAIELALTLVLRSAVVSQATHDSDVAAAHDAGVESATR